MRSLIRSFVCCCDPGVDLLPLAVGIVLEVDGERPARAVELLDRVEIGS